MSAASAGKLGPPRYPVTDPLSRVIESRIENCWTPSRPRGTIRLPFFLSLSRPRLTGPQGPRAVAPAAPAAAPMNVLRSSLRAMCVAFSPAPWEPWGAARGGAPESSTG